MSSLPSLIPTAAAFLAAWFIWKVFQSLQPSPLDNIPGPSAVSFIKGKVPIYLQVPCFFDVYMLGNFAQFFSDNMREYQIALMKKCECEWMASQVMLLMYHFLRKDGSVVRLKFVLGVRNFSSSRPQSVRLIGMTLGERITCIRSQGFAQYSYQGMDCLKYSGCRLLRSLS